MLCTLPRTKELTEYDEEERPEGPSVIGLESFLKGLSPRTIQFHLGDEINQMLKKYRALKAKLEEQEEEVSAHAIQINRI